MKHLAGHVGGILAGEEQEGWCDLVWLSRPAHWCVLAELGDFLSRLTARGIEWSPDRSGSDAVHADTLLDQVQRKRAREGGDRSLGRTIVEQALGPGVHRFRRAVDDRRSFSEMR